MALRFVAPAIALALFACGGASRAEPKPSTVTERQPLTAAAASIRIRNVGLGTFAIVAEEAVRVSATAAIEMQRADGSWILLTDVDDGAGFQLRASCASDAGGGKPCIALRAGDVLSPVRLARGKCQCRECQAPYEGGAHRLVVSTCGDNSLRIPGPAFELPAAASLEPRWDATFEVDGGSAVRVDLATEDAASALLGLYRPRESTRQPLSAAALARLVELVRSGQGTEDAIVKRCPPGPSVAFELRASIAGVPAMTARDTAVVLDFGCAALNVVDAARRTLSVAYFDHRFGDYVALAREALPDDREVARLH